MDVELGVLEQVGEVDPDILEMLNGASMGWLRPYEAYLLGVIDGRNYVIDSDKISRMKAMIPAAEMFYDRLRKMLPDGAIRQHRIGIDEKTGVTTSLSIIAAEHEECLMDIMHVARQLELALFQRHDLDYSFWVIADRNLDQELIELDFPYYKSNINAVK